MVQGETDVFFWRQYSKANVSSNSVSANELVYFVAYPIPTGMFLFFSDS